MSDTPPASDTGSDTASDTGSETASETVADAPVPASAWTPPSSWPAEVRARWRAAASMPPTNIAGQAVQILADPRDGSLRAAAPNGRLTVAVGQTIESAWGNTTYDQTMQTFASSADRTNQWPAPNEGSLSYLVDSHTPWIFRNGAWHGLPLGYLAATQASEAATARTANSFATSSNFCPATVAVASGRQYRIEASCWASCTASSNPAIIGQIAAGTSAVGGTDTTRMPTSGIGQTCRVDAVYQATTTGNVTFASRWWMAGTSPTSWQFSATDPLRLVVSDIGS